MASKKDNIFGAMRFVLPEQKAAYLEHLEELKLVPQPVLEGDEIEEIHRHLLESMHEDHVVRICWWRATRGMLGMVEEDCGRIHKIDTFHQQIKLASEEGFQWIRLNALVSVKSM